MKCTPTLSDISILLFSSLPWDGRCGISQLILGHIQSPRVQNINLGLILTTDEKGKIYRMRRHQTTGKELWPGIWNIKSTFHLTQREKGTAPKNDEAGKERVSGGHTCGIQVLPSLYLASVIPHPVPQTPWVHSWESRVRFSREKSNSLWKACLTSEKSQCKQHRGPLKWNLQDASSWSQVKGWQGTQTPQWF